MATSYASDIMEVGASEAGCVKRLASARAALVAVKEERASLVQVSSLDLSLG